MIDLLAKEILKAGLDDWVPLLAVDSLARRFLSSTDEDSVHREVIETINYLVVENLVEIGEITDGGFSPWGDSVADALMRIKHSYQGFDANRWGFTCWLNNTPQGDRIGKIIVDNTE
ncbi:MULTISPECIES: hypothetical protein [unclassified Frankia]|uniref:hypothetical protein n=1 Tax=unclassified Frankia TaxID=2632575 RepID=UPI001EF4EFBC|nr:MULTISPECIES: hypothetical protein [unclassified Frankia]